MELDVFESGKIKKLRSFDGTEISYYFHKKSEKNLVFLHGDGSNHTVWIPMLIHFGKGYSILAPDARGHGRSSRIEDVSIKSFAKDLLVLMKKEKIKKATLIGNCSGASTILEFYKRYPEKVDKIVLLTPFSARIIRLSGILRKLNRFVLFIIKGFKSKRKLKFQNYQKYYRKNRPVWFYPLLDIRGTSVITFLGILNELFIYELDFKSIDKKTLILIGRRDTFSKNKVIRDMTKQNKKIKLRILDTNHVPLAKKYEEIIKIIERFLE